MERQTEILDLIGFMSDNGDICHKREALAKQQWGEKQWWTMGMEVIELLHSDLSGSTVGQSACKLDSSGQ